MYGSLKFGMYRFSSHAFLAPFLNFKSAHSGSKAATPRGPKLHPHKRPMHIPHSSAQQNTQLLRERLVDILNLTFSVKPFGVEIPL